MARSFRLAFVALCLTLFHAWPVLAQTTRTVTSTANAGPGTLRDTIAQAASGDTIVFNLSYPATIFVADTKLTIDKSLTIVGPGPSSLTISGEPIKPGVLPITYFNVFTIQPNVTVNISGVKITNGQAFSYGGGIYNYGTLNLDNVIVANNIAYNQEGGGIYTEGALTLANSVVNDNAAPSAGGGIYSRGTTTIINSFIAHNTVGDSGPQSAAHGNGVANHGTMLVVRSTVFSNFGGGNGGGFGNVGTLTLVNTTLADNNGGRGSAIWNVGTTNLVQSTVAGNRIDPDTPTPIYNQHHFTMKNSIVAMNAGRGCEQGGSTQPITSLGYNLSDTNTCATGPADMVNTNAGFFGSPLWQDNGGPTLTIALGPVSAAVDAIPAAFCTDLDGYPILIDQRGMPRPQGPTCDIGAFELVETGVYTVTTSPAGLFVVVDGATYTGPQEFHWLAGGGHSLSAGSYADSDGTQWVFDGWSDGEAPAHFIVAPATPGTYTANFHAPTTDVTVTTVPPGRTITVDGQSSTAPQTFNWNYGSHHSIATDATQAGTAGTQYVFAGWSDSGAIAHSVTVPEAPLTLTASFTTQYLLTTNANPAAGGSVTSSGYFDAGASVPIAASANAGYTFASFSGSVSGTTSPQTLVMSSPQSVTANFTALSSAITITTVPAGRAITVDGVSYTAPQSFNWATASSHTVSTGALQSSPPGTQFVFGNWSDGGAITHTITGPTAPTTYTATFTTQYLLTTSVSPAGAGTVSAGGYVNAGASVPVSASANAGYTFAAFSGGLSATTSPQTLVMSSPLSVTANFTPAVSAITIATSPTGKTITVDGVSFTAPQTFNWTTGSSHTVSTPATVPGAVGTQFAFANWSDGGAMAHTITGPAVPTTYTASFTTQYLLTTDVSPAGTGTVTSGGYFNEGASVQIAASAGAGYTFTGFSGSLSGTTKPQTLVMSSPQSVTANFAGLTSAITIATAPAGRAIVVDGLSYTAPQTFNWATGSSHTVETTSIQAVGVDTRFVFGSWSDGGGISHTITGPPAPATYTANFTTQYLLSTAVTPAAGGSVTASGYVNAGAPVDITATPSTGYRFTGFSGAVNGMTNPQTLAMNAPASVTASFVPASDSVTVTNLDDSGPGSLREALVVVNDGGVINFGAVSTGTLFLSSTLTIDKSVTINGPVSTLVSVHGQNAVRVFSVAAGTTVTIARLTIANGSADYGGGVFNAGTLTLARSTVSGNSADAGGGIFNFGAVTLTNSTVSGNSSFEGSVYNQGTMAVNNSTIALNTAAGLVTGAGSLTVKNTLLARNREFGASVNCRVNGGSFIDAGHNLSDDFTCEPWLTESSDVPAGTASGLTVLRQNGGPTPTLPLLSTSAAVNAIPVEFCTDGDGNPIATDQRGAARPQGAACDIGASELAPAPTANAQTLGTSPNTPLTITLTSSGFVNCEMTFTVIGGAPSHGALGTAANQPCVPGNPHTDSATILYTPDSGFSGDDSFTFRVADGAANSATATIAITVGQGGQTITVTTHAPSAAAFGDTFTVAATADSLLPVAITATGACGVSASGSDSATIQMTAGTGACTVHYNQAGDGNHSAASEVTEPVNASLASQTTLAVTGPGNVMYGSTGTATASGGSGTGVVTFSAGASTGCAVNGTTVTVSDASGTCALTATKAADSNYDAATSAPFTVTLSKASQATLTVTGPGSVQYGATGTATSSGGSGTGAVTFSAGASTGCTVNGTTVSVIDANGTCVLAATKAADDNYDAATSAPLTVTLSKTTQTTLTVTGPGSVTFGTTGTATASGGSGTGVVTFSAGASTGCAVNGTIVSVTNASGTCALTATKAGDNTYAAATSAPFAVTLTKANQAALTVTGPGSVNFGTTGTATSNGGSGTGAVTFSAGSSTGCAVNGTAVSVSNAGGSCALTATRAADDNYNATTSPSFTVALRKGTQPTLTVAGPASVMYGTTGVATFAGGGGTGAVTFSVGTSTGCTLAGTTVSVRNLGGTCALVATKAADANYNAAASAATPVQLLKANQTITFNPLANVNTLTPVVIAATSSSGLAVTFTTATPAICTATGPNGSKITLQATGTCSVVAHQAGNANYNAAVDVVQSFVASKADQTITFPALANRTTAPPSVRVSATASSGLTVTFTTTTPTVCTAEGKQGASIKLRAPGTCTVVADQGGNASFNAAPPVSRSFTVTAAPGRK